MPSKKTDSGTTETQAPTRRLTRGLKRAIVHSDSDDEDPAPIPAPSAKSPLIVLKGATKTAHKTKKGRKLVATDGDEETTASSGAKGGAAHGAKKFDPHNFSTQISRRKHKVAGKACYEVLYKNLSASKKAKLGPVLDETYKDIMVDEFSGDESDKEKQDAYLAESLKRKGFSPFSKWK